MSNLLKPKRRGRTYQLVASVNRGGLMIREESKWDIQRELPMEHYVIRITPKSGQSRALYRECDRFLKANWPDFKSVWPNELTR